MRIYACQEIYISVSGSKIFTHVNILKLFLYIRSIFVNKVVQLRKRALFSILRERLLCF